MVKTLKRKRSPGAFTFDDYCLLVKEGQKGDLIDGVIYLSPPEELETNCRNQWLMGVLDDFAIERDLGDVFGYRIAFRLDDINAPEPDLAFVYKSRRGLRRTNFIDGPPDAAFEIVTRESIERDYILKLEQYKQFGVGEYWMIDEIEKTVVLYRRSKNGKYQEARPKDGVYYSEVIDGFWLDPKWLWQSPKPRRSTILEQLLDSTE